MTIKTKTNEIWSWLTNQRGNVLAYIAMVLIIFGVLGGVMASLLTSSMTSSATPNYSRRALYMTEAGMRYGLSELRNSEFATSVIDTLNTTTYTLNPDETFTLNIFGPWFDSDSDQTFSSGGDLTLRVPEGKFPQEYIIPTNIWAVNLDYIGDVNDRPSTTTMRDKIGGFSRIDDTTLTINVTSDFIVNMGERVCLAVEPTHSQLINEEGSNLYVEREAKDFLPQYNGAIEISRVNYVYERLVDEPGNNRVRLENLSYSKMPNSKDALPEVVVEYNGNYTGDFVVLSPKNYIIIPTGTSESISAGGTLDEAVYTYDQYAVKPMARKPDIDADEFTDNLSGEETIPGFMEVEQGEDRLIIGGTGGGSGSVEFGASWYDANKAIGGDQDFCTILDGCKFGLGIRAFFTLDYTGTGDGLVFALMNGPDNDASSVGGDIELSELLGYAGDSRLVPNPAAGADYLDSAGVGIQPPKLAVEFDMQTNNDFQDYCVDSNTLRQNTRKDPLSNDRDAIQYVYWGNTVLDIDCRADDPSYDDNRHNAEGLDEISPWPAPFTTSGDVRSKPIIGPNDTLYVATLNGYLHAIDLNDGTEKWTFPNSDPTVADLVDIVTNPAINDSGDTIYVAERDGSTRRLWAINTSDGTKKWVFPESDPAVASMGRTDESSPAVDRNGLVYSGESDGDSDGNFRAIRPTGIQKWVYDVNEEVESDVIVDRTGIGNPYDGYIYVGADGGRVMQFSPGHTQGDEPEWSFTTGPDIETAPALSDDGSIVYALGENGTVYAINASDGTSAWGSNPDTDGSYHDSNPVVDASGSAYDGTIYIMNSDQDGIEGAYLSSVKADGSGFNWERVPVKDAAAGSPEHSKSSPAVGSDGTIYVGSDDDHLYAISPSDGSVKWRINLGADVRSSPTVGADGTVYVGSDDNKVWAIYGLALPRNRRDLYVTSTLNGPNTKVGGEIVEVDNLDDWLKGDTLKGPWAVRIEVMRSSELNVNGNYDYTLRTWIRQCDTEPSSPDCTDTDIIGAFFQDTRIQYDAKVPHIAQTVELSTADHTEFERFLFGFTGATGAGESQSAIIDKFQLSFIRSGDPVVTTDPLWP